MNTRSMIMFCRYYIFIGDKIYNQILSFYFRLTKEQFALINVSNLTIRFIFLFFISRLVITCYFYIALHKQIALKKNEKALSLYAIDFLSLHNQKRFYYQSNNQTQWCLKYESTNTLRSDIPRCYFPIYAYLTFSLSYTLAVPTYISFIYNIDIGHCFA